MDIKPKRKILIVDDHKDMVETLQDVFEKEGYQTIVAHTGTQAIKLVKLYNIKLILMDVRLPDINGVETFIQIKELIPDVKVIMMTAFSVEGLLRKARKEGVYGVLNKPFNIRKVINIIKKGLTDNTVFDREYRD